MSIIGTGSSGAVTEVRMYLRAESADALVRSQFLNNLKYKSQFGYTDFTQSPVDKQWYCWFLIDIQLLSENKPVKKRGR